MKCGRNVPRALLFFLHCLIAAPFASAQFNFVNIAVTSDGGSGTIALAGHYVYMANRTNGLRIYDISSPANPVVIGNTTNNNGRSTAYDVAVSGNYAYVAYGDSVFGQVYDDSLRIYDVSNPANPILVGHTNGAPYYYHNAYKVGVSGNFAYLAQPGSDGLISYNISDPSHPFMVSGRTADTSDFALSGNYLYLPDATYPGGNGSLTIYRLDTNPGYPSPVSSTNLSYGNYGHGIAVSGNYAYMETYSGVFVVDVSNPVSPLKVGSVSYQGYSYFSKWGDYLMGPGGPPYVYSIVHPANPVIAGTFPPHNKQGLLFDPGRVVSSDNYLFATGNQPGLHVFVQVPQPSLVRAGSGQVSVSWPTPLAPGFVLQQNSNLTATNWLDATNTPVVISNRNQVILPATEASAFFRLKLQ